MTSMAPSQGIHPEDRELIENLAKLQDIHNQIHNLRGLLPERLLKPTRLVLEHPAENAPAKLAAQLMLAAAQGSVDIKRFKRDFRGEPMQDLWLRTNASSLPQGRDAWTNDYLGLMKADGSGGGDVIETKQTTGPDAVSTEGSEDVQAVISTFRDANPMVKVNSPDITPFPLDVLVNGMAFRVTNETSSTKLIYHVDEQPGRKYRLNVNVLNYIKNGGPYDNLANLLGMLASYQNLQSRHCDKCHDIFDDDLAYPFIRRRKPVAEKDSKIVEWSAYHRGCAP